MASCAGAAGIEPAPATTEAAVLELAPLDALVGDAPLVILGEDSHGMPAIHQVAADTFRWLVENKGFRTFVFESSWGVEDAITAYLDSGRTELTQEESFFLNAFNSEPTRELLLWIRAWNRNHPGDRIRVTGYQPEQPVTDAEALHALATAAPSLGDVDEALGACRLARGTHDTNIAFLTASFAERREGRPLYSVEAREACLAGLGDIGRRIAAGRAELVAAAGAERVREAELHLLSLSTYVALLSLAGDAMSLGDAIPVDPAEMQALGYNEGDRVRFEIFEAMRAVRDDQDARTFLWMHNWHAARRGGDIDMVFGDTASRSISLGQRLAERYGTDLVVIGHVTPCGDDCEEPADSVETAFAEAFGERPAIIDFDRVARELPIHRAGSLYANKHRARFGSVVLADQFDGLIYLPDGEHPPEAR